MSNGIVTVFGADGFLGHNVIRALVKNGWRVRAAVRRPHTAQDLRVIGSVGQVQLVQANVRYGESVDKAVNGSDAVINLVGILTSKGKQNFNAVHHVAVHAIAESAAAHGISNLVHVSALGVGSGEKTNCHYLISKEKGEEALKLHLPSADIVRPSILFGKGDSFFSKFGALTNISLVLPLIGGGKTRFQPIYVGDVATHIVGCLERGTNGQIYELGGPQTYTFKQLMQFVLAETHKKRLLMPMPWLIAMAVGFIFDVIYRIPIVNLLIKPLVTTDQVRALKVDNVISGDYPGLEIADETPGTIEAIVPETLIPYRKYGQFYEPMIES